MRLKFFWVAVTGIFASAGSAHAQGCALCYTSASAIGANAQRSLAFGILALLAPALILFLGVIFMLYRRAASASA